MNRGAPVFFDHTEERDDDSKRIEEIAYAADAIVKTTGKADDSPENELQAEAVR